MATGDVNVQNVFPVSRKKTFQIRIKNIKKLSHVRVLFFKIIDDQDIWLVDLRSQYLYCKGIYSLENFTLKLIFRLLMIKSLNPSKILRRRLMERK